MSFHTALRSVLFGMFVITTLVSAHAQDVVVWLTEPDGRIELPLGPDCAVDTAVPYLHRARSLVFRQVEPACAAVVLTHTPHAKAVQFQKDTLTNERLAAILALPTEATVLEILCPYATFDRATLTGWPRLEGIEVFSAGGFAHEEAAQRAFQQLVVDRPGAVAALNGRLWPE